MDGNFLPPQLIYAGKTPKCLPKVDFPEDWDIIFMENHTSYNCNRVRVYQIACLHFACQCLPYSCRPYFLIYVVSSYFGIIYTTFSTFTHGREVTGSPAVKSSELNRRRIYVQLIRYYKRTSIQNKGTSVIANCAYR